MAQIIFFDGGTVKADLNNDGYREANGIIKRDEILSLMEYYNMSRQFLSNLMGISEKLINAYIDDNVIPNEQDNEKLKRLKYPYSVKQLYDHMICSTHSYRKKQICS